MKKSGISKPELEAFFVKYSRGKTKAARLSVQTMKDC